MYEAEYFLGIEGREPANWMWDFIMRLLYSPLLTEYKIIFHCFYEKYLLR